MIQDVLGIGMACNIYTVSYSYQHIEEWTQLPTFCKQKIQLHYIEWNIWILNMSKEIGYISILWHNLFIPCYKVI